MPHKERCGSLACAVLDALRVASTTGRPPTETLPYLIEMPAVTGHKDLRMLKRYYHPRATDLAKKLG